MSQYSPITLAAVIVAICIFVFLRTFNRFPVPPGPKPLPVVGNLFQMPKEREWLVFSEWSKIYGDCIFLKVLWQPILVLNSYNTANDLLDARSAIYSSRPRLIMAGELVGFNQALALMPYTERFRQMRQLLKKELVGNTLKKYWHLHEQESRTLIRKLIANPSGLFESIRHYSGSVILKVTYGYQTTPKRDPFLLLAEIVMGAFSEASQPGTWLVDLIPWLRHLPDWTPGAIFKRKAVEWSKLHTQVIEGPYMWAKGRQVRPKAIHQSRIKLTYFVAGGTQPGQTVASISSFFLAMALHPDIQRRGQEEIDRVLRGTRLPNIDDRSSLPYVESIMREILRWNPVAPLGLPHLLTKDDVYNGHHIPKGTIVMANIWSMLHKPSVFPEPEKFLPDRFLGNDRAIKAVGVAFGFGRRACPGAQFAETSVFIAIATALATCTISDAIDGSGHSVPKDVPYGSGLISHPQRFTCTIKPRSPNLATLLNGDVDE